MTAVMSRDGLRVLTGAASAAQRLSDALRIQRGSYAWSRDYGSDLLGLVDRTDDPGFEAAAFAAVADAVDEPANGLADVRLRSVRLAREGDVVTVQADALWIDPNGAAGTPIAARAALAAAGDAA